MKLCCLNFSLQSFLLLFTAYYDDYKVLSLLSDHELRNSFLRVFQIISNSLISGTDILLRNTETAFLSSLARVLKEIGSSFYRGIFQIYSCKETNV